jgi:hypothetical protein
MQLILPLAQHLGRVLFLSIVGKRIMDASILSDQASSSIDCPDGPFKTDIDRLSQISPRDTPPVRSQQGTNFVVPIEVSRIVEGGISFFEGGSMNEGITTWYAFDVERRLFVAVLGTMSGRSGHIPAAERLSSNQLLRYTDAAGYTRAEFATVIEATPVQVREFSCLANKLLASELEETSRPTPEDTITRTFSLLHNGKSLDLGNGRKRWEIEGELVRFINQPLQEPIMRAYER